MKSQLKELISKIFSDEKAKDEFMSNPESFISRFDLTKAEKTAVLKTHSRLGLVSSNSTRLEAAIDPMSDWM